MHDIKMDEIPFLKKLRTIPGVKLFIWGLIVFASILFGVGVHYPNRYIMLDKLAINHEKQTPCSVYQYYEVEFVFSGIKFPDKWKRVVLKAEEISEYSRQYVFNDIALYLQYIYPPGFLDDYVDTVFYVKALTMNGTTWGGTRDQEQRLVYAQSIVTLVGEISSLLYFDHYSEFPKEWTEVWGRHYRRNSRDIVAKIGVSEYKPEFLKLGFVSEYAMSDEENDFNMMYANLYNDPETLFQHAEEHELLGRKLELTISFLSKVMGENLDKEYFLARSLRQYRITPNTISAAIPVVHEALKAVIAAEHRNYEKNMIDNSEYFEHLRLIIMGVEMKFLKMGLGEEHISKLIDGLKEYMKHLFVELCMKQFEERDDVFDDDDTEEARRGYKDSFEALWEEADPSKPVK